mmetsp:Transcript_28187/g.24979  ORF Transcript_28187/g.24979 Transcript_28187/m.24979 type:complete len:213 (-) Transcript_28187:733-1371(-)
MKWWRPVFCFLLLVALLNAYTLYLEDYKKGKNQDPRRRTPLSKREFMLKIAEKLCEEQKENYAPQKRNYPNASEDLITLESIKSFPIDEFEIQVAGKKSHKPLRRRDDDHKFPVLEDCELRKTDRYLACCVCQASGRPNRRSQYWCMSCETFLCASGCYDVHRREVAVKVKLKAEHDMLKKEEAEYEEANPSSKPDGFGDMATMSIRGTLRK